ncbi:DNAJ domain-containing protein [Emiliania huxleyi CCMP1516]|uniref:J domain-containing protein n=2 Tax=Emiliania huxleyi TaxID=2903 RepID=A0A0D3IMG7_EMIH1|nr:DNAJ domain-containing protein [Emiliania huxleyi CCMP1516]EOD12452.1 DNAJ domain-containing protein [Emiliania huxleyi CCMP1516]|eukprot:XP_005764881.1 DNAJ domain-containing protein [Emiliania huxleyi CCMP1516]
MGERLAKNPETMKNMQAAAAGFRAVGDKFRLSSLMDRVNEMRGGSACGFEANMSRREASQILGIRESATKAQIKDAHRKIMLLNHPDRGGSPFIATKINQASEVMMGQDRSSGSAFS